MTKEVGTLREIGARVGDVVELVKAGMDEWNYPEIGHKEEIGERGGWHGVGYEYLHELTGQFRIIRRASRPFNTLTAEEKGELLLANHEGKIIEMSIDGGETWERSYTPQWIGAACYRVKADDVKEVYLSGCGYQDKFVFGNFAHPECSTHRITFNLVNGKPDCASVKMEEIK